MFRRNMANISNLNIVIREARRHPVIAFSNAITPLFNQGFS